MERVQYPLGPLGCFVVIKLVTGHCLHQPVYPQVAFGRDGDQARFCQGTHRLSALQLITEHPGKNVPGFRHARTQKVKVDVVWIQERAQPKQLHRGRVFFS